MDIFKNKLKLYLKTHFMKYSVKGENNKLIAVKDGKEYALKRFSKNFEIIGNNNTVSINCDKLDKIEKALPAGLKFTIHGNNNRIELEYPLRIKNITIIMDDDNNLFSIKTTKNSFYNAHFRCSHQSSIIIGKDSEIGNGNFRCICNQNYKIPHKLVIGDGVHIARDTLIRTADGQFFVDPETGRPLDPPGDIIIGNNVWIMTNCMIIKNTYIPDGCAVAAKSFVNKKFTEENCLIGGTPARVLKRNIKWVPYKYKDYMTELAKNGKLEPEWAREGLSQEEFDKITQK